MTTVRLCHLYPDEMNIYADRGNIVFVLVAAGGCSILLFAATARVLQARHKRIQKSLV